MEQKSPATLALCTYTSLGTSTHVLEKTPTQKTLSTTQELSYMV